MQRLEGPSCVHPVLPSAIRNALGFILPLVDALVPRIMPLQHSEQEGRMKEQKTLPGTRSSLSTGRKRFLRSLHRAWPWPSHATASLGHRASPHSLPAACQHAELSTVG